jgi:glycosyltransferase involved in cell wall biosynthesis
MMLDDGGLASAGQDIGQLDAPLRLNHRALYAAFDRFPAPKGAAVHIARMAPTLFGALGGGLLYVLGDGALPVYQREGDVEILRHARQVPNFLARALDFGARLDTLLDIQAESLRIAHFRDPWGGVPLLSRPGRRYRTVYEINGLPSVELPNFYPGLPQATLAKFRAAEVFCWSAADRLVVPSATLRENLIGLGAPEEKLVVIPNGADILPEQPPPPDAPPRYLLYFGALQPWQGVDVALRALALLADLPDLELVICAAVSPRRARPYEHLAGRLGVASRVRWLFGLSERELAPWRAHALLSLAPLTECPRNLEQGCCPLKILESMAAGVPVIASDLPVVREIITAGVDGWLVRPDRPAALARAIRVLLDYSEQRRVLGEAARRRIAEYYTWEHATERLAEVYRELLR